MLRNRENARESRKGTFKGTVPDHIGEGGGVGSPSFFVSHAGCFVATESPSRNVVKRREGGWRASELVAATTNQTASR